MCAQKPEWFGVSPGLWYTPGGRAPGSRWSNIMRDIWRDPDPARSVEPSPAEPVTITRTCEQEAERCVPRHDRSRTAHL